MVQMFRLKCKSSCDRGNVIFTFGKIYTARRAKSGLIFAKNDNGNWVQMTSPKLSRANDIFKSDFEIIETFTVKNHKEAVAYEIAKEET